MSNALFVVFHRPTPRYALWDRDFSLSTAYFRFIPKKIDRVYLVDSGWFFRDPPHPRAVVFHSDHNPLWVYLERHLPEVQEDNVLITHSDTLLYGRDCVSDTFKQLESWDAVGESDHFFATKTAVFRHHPALIDFPAFVRASGLRVKPSNQDKRDVFIKNDDIFTLDDRVQSPRTAYFHAGSGSLGMELVSMAENDPYLFDQRISRFGVSVALRAILYKQLIDGLAGTARDYHPLVKRLVPRTLWDRYVRSATALLRFFRPTGLVAR